MRGVSNNIFIVLLQIGVYLISVLIVNLWVVLISIFGKLPFFLCYFSESVVLRFRVTDTKHDAVRCFLVYKT